MSEWISVKDRMPAHKSTVVILMEKREKYDYVNIVLYDANKNAFLWQDGSEIEGVEFWRHCYSNKVIQCCTQQPSKRSNSGFKTIKVTDMACYRYKKEERK